MILASIIIPTLNRSASLDKTLKSILSYSSNSNSYEIIVVDNGSTDSTPAIVKYYQDNFKGISIRYICDPEPGLLTGRHRGAQEAAGDILTFIDDDVIVSSTWIDTIITTLQQRKDISFITGPNLPLFEAYPPWWLQYFWATTPYGGKMCTWLSLLDLGDKPIEINPGYVFGLNFTIRKNDFIELGGFHPDNISPQYQMYQGDGETGLATKGLEQNKIALYHPGALLYHQTPASRLTYEYFDKRAYYQGVCNSYTEIRRAAGLYAKVNEQKTAVPGKSLKSLIPLLVSKLTNTKQAEVPAEIKALFERLSSQEFNGYQFHQNSFANNANVKEWCLRKDYFNYKLPV